MLAPFIAIFLSALCQAAEAGDPAAIAAWHAAVARAGREQAPGTPAPPQEPPTGTPTQVDPRDNFRNEQQPAPRAGNQSLDPQFANYLQIPNTPVIMKFNAKPRADFTFDTRNSGNEDRFVTAQIPTSDEPDHGGGRRFNINAKGSQLSIDVRAPTVDGAPRFQYQNDFFGSGGGEFPFRVRQLYGQIYNVIVGMTFSVFEDPDVWPDTVDYEGPNSAIFARRPLARYMLALNEEWQLNFGIEQPESEIDTSIDPNAAGVNRSPDIGMNARWEKKDVGHVQLAIMGRHLGVRGPITGNQGAFGFGVNLSAVFTTSGRDSLQLQLTYGEGIFRYSNDDFIPNDAAFDRGGNLEPIPYFGALWGYTHHWNDEWRSTGTYGYVHLRNQFSQAPTAYHRTHYASLNVVWQIRKRLSIGLEGLYGSKEDKAERHGNDVRAQFGLLYSLLD
jgi:hypothetical protein